jgi:hypothetical protein
MGDAFDGIVKKEGMPLPITDWVRDDELKKSRQNRSIFKAIANLFGNPTSCFEETPFGAKREHRVANLMAASGKPSEKAR